MCYFYAQQFDDECTTCPVDQLLHADVGTGADLVQVDHWTRLDGPSGLAPYGGPAFGVRSTQYRYYDGEELLVLGEEPELRGAVHQLKMVINPEQIEYYASYDSGLGGDIADRVLRGARELLKKSDDLTAFTEPDSTVRKVKDLAAKLVSYHASTSSSTGARADWVDRQYLQSACGCAGGTQGSKLGYQYFSYTGTPNSRSTIVSEYVLGSSGFPSTPYRRWYYDMTDVARSSRTMVYLKTLALAEVGSGGSDSRRWVWHYRYHSTSGTLTRAMYPSAFASLSDYTPATSSTAPSFATATPSSGYVDAFSWNGDNRIVEWRCRSGESTTFTDFTRLVEVTYRTDSGRTHLPATVTHFRTEQTGSSSPSADTVQVTSLDYGFHSGPTIAWVKTTTEAELESENGPGGSHDSYELYDAQGLHTWSLSADDVLTFRKFDDATGRVIKVVRNAHKDEPDGETEDALDGGDYASVTVTGWGRDGGDGG